MQGTGKICLNFITFRNLSLPLTCISNVSQQQSLAGFRIQEKTFIIMDDPYCFRHPKNSAKVWKERGMQKRSDLIFALVIGLVLGLGTVVNAQSFENGNTKVWAFDKGKDKRKARVAVYGFSGQKRLGVSAEDFNPEKAKQYAQQSGLDRRGVLVESVHRNTAADRAGIKSGDLIVEIDGQPIESVRALQEKLQQIDYDRPATITVFRQGAPVQLSFTLEKSQNSEVWNFEEGAGFSRGRLGVFTQSLNAQLGEYFGVENGRGVLITSVVENSPAARAGLKAGDVIVEVNGVAINREGDVRRELGKIDSGQVRISVIRNRQRIDLMPVLEPRPMPPAFSKLSFKFPMEGQVFTIPALPAMPEMVIPEIVIPNFEFPKIEIPEFEPCDFDFTEFI
jgi:membrane-associated protease RseP (regulator of RpoE activity)